MKVFNHIIVEEVITGISPVKVEKGVHKDRLYFEIYTKGGAVKIESQWYDDKTPDGPAVLKSFEADHAAALSAIAKVTKQETRVYCQHVDEVETVFRAAKSDLNEVLLLVPEAALENDQHAKATIEILKNRIAHLRNLAIK